VRAGHDISLELAIDAGVPIQELTSSSHEIDIEHTATHTAKVTLRNQEEIPNRDFILKYKVAGSQISDAILTSAASAKSRFATGGYFSLILQPPVRVPESDITPKELVFVLDTSGSMMGFPIEKGKAMVEKALDELYPGDTFNLITFSGDTQILFPEPVFPTADNIRIAKQFLAGRSGNGGTEMMKAIRASLAPSDAQDHIRIVCFITDGFVGNDMEIIGEVQKHPHARVFSFGIGSSVNRFLLDGMAKAGRGAVEYVTLHDDADKASHRLYERIRSPLLTDVSIDWERMPVAEVYPTRIPDLFSGQPLVITGRYTGSAHGTIRLRGTRAGEAFVRDIAVDFGSHAPADGLIANFWARRKIDDLMSQDWSGAQRGNMKPALQDQITAIGLDYGLMTQFTSFVAVEDRVVTTSGKPERVEVPVEMPEGVSREGIFGEPSQSMQFARAGSFTAAQTVGVAGGVAGGVGSGVFYLNKSGPAAAPPPPPIARGTRDSEEMDASTHAEEKPPSKERALLESKVAPALLATFDCWQKSKSGCNSAQDGKVEITIWLTEVSNTALEQLKQLGFEISADRSSSKSVVGRLPLEKLEALAHLSQVKFMSPMRR
jgi:Ca-activated chloride channel family protein